MLSCIGVVVRRQDRTATVERVLARIAAEARGLVTHGQMVDAGVTLGEIRWRLGTGACCVSILASTG